MNKFFKKLHNTVEDNKWIQSLSDKMKPQEKDAYPENLERRLKKRLKIESPLAKSDTTTHSVLSSFKHAVSDELGAHNSDLYHELNASIDLSPGFGDTTQRMHVCPKPNGDLVVIKSPLSLDQHTYWSSSNHNPITDSFSHFQDSSFSTTRREAIFHALADKFFNLGQYVPKTAIFTHPGDNKVWSAQEYIKDSTSYHNPEQLKGLESSGVLHKLAIMETILGHQDRNKSNIRIDRHGAPKLIDNALSFDFSHLYGTPYPAYAKHLMSKPVHNSVHSWLSLLSPPKIISLMESYGVPVDAQHIVVDRLVEFKRWSNETLSHDVKSDLGSAIELARVHRFWSDGSGVNEQDILNEGYNRVNSGNSIWSDPNNSDDKTGIFR